MMAAVGYRLFGSRHWLVAAAVLVGASTFKVHPAAAPVTRPDAQRDYVELFRELVETDTTLSHGSCTAAAGKMARRLSAAGFAAADIQQYSSPEHPLEGGLVATLHAAHPIDKGLLLIAHLDVVEVRREDWTRDPFTLTEESGYFYGRGVSDDKAMAATLVDTLIRLKSEKFRARRDLKIALTCGEETATAFNGARYLAQSQRALIDASFALVPSGGAQLDTQGRRVSLSIQAGEKVPQNFQLEVTHPGGHSSRPVKHDAIARLAAGLVKLADFDFPLHLSEATRAHFTRSAALETGALATALATLGRTADGAAPDATAVAMVANANPGWNSMLRTTCATTLLRAGDAINALAQRATATVNCRMLPGETVENTEGTLHAVLTDPGIVVTRVGPASPTPPAPPLGRAILEPIETVASQLWPGTPIIPTMLTGATDARHFNAVGIPTYGLTAVFNDPDGNGVHAQNERVRVRSVLEGREFVYRLVRRYASGN
jgi:acetylornithine deacetylase/succinyl-diaminopimelate desuccinylase-like protein